MKYSKSQFNKFILPIIQKIIGKHEKGKTLIIGIQGGQGTGKTTLVRVLKKELKKKGYKVQSFSIDDFYETYEKRQKLAKTHKDNPFYQISRGLPGTHRVKYLYDTLRKIKQGKPFEIPIFDKSLHNAVGDVLNKTIKVKEKQDFILFEGWCLGIPCVSLKTFFRICKTDIKAKHCKVVLQHIKQYEKLWKFIDYLIMMEAKSPNLYQKWRYKQEKELKKKTGRGMSKKQVYYFVSLYLPFTRLCCAKVKPDLKLRINERHKFY